MVVARGQVWWANLGVPVGSEPGYRRPVLVVQADRFNESGIRTVIIAGLSSNTDLSRHPGNVFIPAGRCGLPKDTVVNITQLMTIDRTRLDEISGSLPDGLMNEVDAGLRFVLDLR